MPRLPHPVEQTVVPRRLQQIVFGQYRKVDICPFLNAQFLCQMMRKRVEQRKSETRGKSGSREKDGPLLLDSRDQCFRDIARHGSSVARIKARNLTARLRKRADVRAGSKSLPSQSAQRIRA
jgi:hypothetical protein